MLAGCLDTRSCCRPCKGPHIVILKTNKCRQNFRMPLWWRFLARMRRPPDQFTSVTFAGKPWIGLDWNAAQGRLSLRHLSARVAIWSYTTFVLQWKKSCETLCESPHVFRLCADHLERSFRHVIFHLAGQWLTHVYCC